MATFGETLRELRRKSKMTQQELADQAGIVRQTITMLEQDRIKAPSSTKLINIARILEVDPDVFFGLLPDVVMPFKPGQAGKEEVIQRLEKVKAELQEITRAVKNL
jgi:transcriptional regulator with XRE-family HTH domain